MTDLRTTLNRPGPLLALSVVLAVLIGIVTSSVFGVGIFLVLPALAAWLLRR